MLQSALHYAMFCPKIRYCAEEMHVYLKCISCCIHLEHQAKSLSVFLMQMQIQTFRILQEKLL